MGNNLNELQACIRRLELRLNRCEAENVVLESEVPPETPPQELMRFETENLGYNFIIYGNSLDITYFVTNNAIFYLPKDPDGYNFDGTVGFGGCIYWQQLAGGVPTETMKGQSIYETLTVTGPDVDTIKIVRHTVLLNNNSDAPLPEDFWIAPAFSELMSKLVGNGGGNNVYTKTNMNVLVFNFAGNALSAGQTIIAVFYTDDSVTFLGTLSGGFLADGNTHSVNVPAPLQTWDRVDFYIHSSGSGLPVPAIVQAGSATNICYNSSGVIVVYTTDGGINTGQTVYSNFEITTPLSGYDFIVNGITGEIFAIDNVTGVVGATTGNSCVVPIYGKQISLINSLDVPVSFNLSDGTSASFNDGETRYIPIKSGMVITNTSGIPITLTIYSTTPLTAPNITSGSGTPVTVADSATYTFPNDLTDYNYIVVT